MKYYDLHTHTTFSDGQLTLPEVVAVANSKGYGLGISDHLFCIKMTTPEKVEAYLDELARWPVLRGVEANLGEDFTLPPKLDAKLDYVIASVHSILGKDGERISLGSYFCARGDHVGEFHRFCTVEDSMRYLKQILKIYEHDFATQRVDILGHCNVTPFHEDAAGSPFLWDWEDKTIALCKRYNVALEVSGLWKEPSINMARRAIRAGVKLSIGSDCHQPASTCDLGYAIDVLKELGATEKDIFIPVKRS